MTAQELAMYMRLGAMLRPQAFGRSFEKGGSCALGAATEAMGLMNTFFVFETSPWYSFFLRCVKLKTRCPECGTLETEHSAHGFLIPHLNDDHRWTREAIAEWVEGLEALEPPPPAPVPVAEEERVEVQ